MKICIATTPIRSRPTIYPPFGSMAIIQSLRKIEEEVHFYHLKLPLEKHKLKLPSETLRKVVKLDEQDPTVLIRKGR